MTSDIDRHFEGTAPEVRIVYDAILAIAGGAGPFQEDPKKTSIHLNRKTAFLGIATRKGALVLTVKSDTPWRHHLITKSEQVSARRWHHDLKLTAADQLDDEIRAHIAQAYALSA